MRSAPSARQHSRRGAHAWGQRMGALAPSLDWASARECPLSLGGDRHDVSDEPADGRCPYPRGSCGARRLRLSQVSRRRRRHRCGNRRPDHDWRNDASVLIVESQRRSGEAAWQEAQRRLRMYGRFVAVFAAAFLVLSVIILVILCRAGGGLSPVECAADSSAPVFGTDARARLGVSRFARPAR